MTLTGSRIISKTDHPGVCIFAEKAVVGQKDPATGVLCQILKNKKSRVLLQICCTPCGMILSEKNRRRENHEKDPDN